MKSTTIPQASWRELLTRQYLPKLAIMALALWLHASNSMLTATTMPSAVDEIGGFKPDQLDLRALPCRLHHRGRIDQSAGGEASA